MLTTTYLCAGLNNNGLGLVLFLCIFLVVVFGVMGPAHAQSNTSEDEVYTLLDEETEDLLFGNSVFRLRFLAGKPQYGLFPTGWTGYAIEMKSDDAWIQMAEAPFFSSYVYRSGWGRDWLHYVVPQTYEQRQNGDAITLIFAHTQADLDAVSWSFTFEFTLRPGEPFADTRFTAQVDQNQEFLLFWGPRLHVGEGTFGAGKDEAIFPGVEYLGPQDKSSAMEALAPDARLHFVPHPSWITIPMMSVIHDGKMVGMMWDPMQEWHGDKITPSAVFASPNRIEDKENHLLGLFAPSVPDYVQENAFRAHTPVELKAGEEVSITARLFALHGNTAVDAVDFWLHLHGGIPTPQATPRPIDEEINKLVRDMLNAYDSEHHAWSWEYGGAVTPHITRGIALLHAASLIEDKELSEQAAAVARENIEAHPSYPLGIALHSGGVERALQILHDSSRYLMEKQGEDGAWGFRPTFTTIGDEEIEIGEAGLRGLMGPPRPGLVAPEGTRTQGITAGKAAQLMQNALITGDQKMLADGLRAIEHMNSYTIPFPYLNAECPPSPSLHGSYFGSRACLLAYRLTGEQKYLDQAVYWAKTGLPFVYLWTLPPQPTPSGQVHGVPMLFPDGDALYDPVTRDAMLYGALYGYGSSQYMHHWYGLLVHWIGYVYASDLAELAKYDQIFPWQQLAEGLVTSGIWQTFDVAPYSGYLPDAFSVERWVPSGPAFMPACTLAPLLKVFYGMDETHTEILHDGTHQLHITTAYPVKSASLEDRVLTIQIPSHPHYPARIVIAGLSSADSVSVDGRELSEAPEKEHETDYDRIEEMDEGWSTGPGDVLIIKVSGKDTPSEIKVQL